MTIRCTCLLIAIFGLPCRSPAANAASPNWTESFTEPVAIIDVAAGEPGRISVVLAKRGQRVQHGDLLMTVDNRILQARRAVAELRANVDSELQAAVVEHEMLVTRFQKLDELFSNGHGNQDEVYRAESGAKIAAFKVQSAKETQRVNQLLVAELDAEIESRHVRSPIDGIVTDVLRDVGEYVAANDPIVAQIVDTSQLRITFYVPTDLATTISKGDSASLLFVHSGRSANVIVEHVAEVTEADSGRVRVDTLLRNVSGSFRSGVRCRIAFESIRLENSQSQVSTKNGSNAR